MPLRICKICKIKPGNTLDHIIPRWLAERAELFGLEEPKNNLQYVCFECNQRKGARLEYSNLKVSNFMEKLVKKIEEQLFY